jgi:Lar family restriction alleviation protein
MTDENKLTQASPSEQSDCYAAPDGGGTTDQGGTDAPVVRDVTPALLPCPFCGGTWLRVTHGVYDYEEAEINHEMSAIFCDDCGACGAWCSDLSNVIAWWNRRARPTN